MLMAHTHEYVRIHARKTVREHWQTVVQFEQEFNNEFMTTEAAGNNVIFPPIEMVQFYFYIMVLLWYCF